MSPLTSVSASRIALGVHHQTAVSEGLLMAVATTFWRSTEDVALVVKIRRKGRMAEMGPDRRSEGFHSPESVQHPAFYRCRESYPRRNGSPRNWCLRAGDERSAVPVSV
jgi:hypothetical protein